MASMMENTMQNGHQLFPPSLWIQNLDSPFSQGPPGVSESLGTFFRPDVYDGIIDSSPSFYLGSSAVQNYNAPFPSDDKAVESAQRSPSPPSDLEYTGSAVADTAIPRDAPGGSQPQNKSTRGQKRKEQNRTAQRAFRQRKEQHVKDLQGKVAVLEASQAKMEAENERLRAIMDRATVENNLLKSLGSPNSPPQYGRYSDSSPTSSQCESESSGKCGDRVGQSSSRRNNFQQKGIELWEFIISHRLVEEGLADVSSVAQHLQQLLRLQGNDSDITEAVLTEIIERSVGG